MAGNWRQPSRRMRRRQGYNNIGVPRTVQAQRLVEDEIACADIEAGGMYAKEQPGQFAGCRLSFATRMTTGAPLVPRCVHVHRSGSNLPPWKRKAKRTRR